MLRFCCLVDILEEKKCIMSCGFIVFVESRPKWNVWNDSILSNWINVFNMIKDHQLGYIFWQRCSWSFKLTEFEAFRGLIGSLVLLFGVFIFSSSRNELLGHNYTCWNRNSVYSITENSRHKSRQWRCLRGLSGSLNSPLNLAAAGSKVSSSGCCSWSLSVCFDDVHSMLAEHN